MEETRTKKSFRNVIFDLFSQIVIYLISFLVRTLFIKVLGEYYLGLNGLFTNILSILSLTELGFGVALSYSLYKPIQEKNVETIKGILNYFTKIYSLVASIIFVFGLALLPFLPSMVDNFSNFEVMTIFSIFLLNNILSYFAATRRSLIIAYQKNYLISIVNMITSVLGGIAYFLILFFTKNYYLYLTISCLLTIINSLLVLFLSKKILPEFSNFKNSNVDPLIKKEILTNTKANIFHKIGGVIAQGSANIFISYFLGLAVVGYYSNYVLLIGIISTFINVVFNAITASIGNLGALNDKTKNTDVFYRLTFFNNLTVVLSGVFIFCLINPFIELWLNDANYILSNYVVIALIFQYIITGLRRTLYLFNSSLGLLKHYVWSPIVEIVLSLSISLVLIKIIGVVGVVIGMSASSFLTTYFVEKIVLVKYKLDAKPKKMLLFETQFWVLSIAALSSGYYLTSLILTGGWLGFLIKFLICCAVALFYLIFMIFSNKYGRWWFELLKNTLRKKKRL